MEARNAENGMEAIESPIAAGDFQGLAVYLFVFMNSYGNRGE